MSDSLLRSTTDDSDQLDISCTLIRPSTSERIDDENKQLHTSTSASSAWTLTENYSLLTVVKRLGIYWRRILSDKIRLLFTLIFMSMLNITARIACFTRRSTPSSPSTFGSLTTSSSTETLAEDLVDFSKSLLLTDKRHKQHSHLPSLPSSTMAHILVQQQTHRTPNISIHPSVTSQKDPTIPMRHSVDDRLFLHDSSDLLNLIKRFASEPQMSKYHTQATNTSGYTRSQSPVIFALSSPSSNTCVQVVEPESHQYDPNDMLYFNCDKSQPVSTSSAEEFTSDTTDDTLPTTTSTLPSPPIIDPLSEPFLATKEDLESSPSENAAVDASPSLNGHETFGERHFHRRRRRSSVTRNSISLDENSSPVTQLEKLDLNQPHSCETQAALESKHVDNKQSDTLADAQPSDQEQSNELTSAEEAPASISRYRGRRLRHRFYRQSASATSPREVSSDASPTFYLPSEALDVESPRVYSPPPSSPSSFSPLPSPLSPTLTILSSPITPSKSAGALKRFNSVGSSKKNVRFADSVGRQLAEVQYIRSPNYDESKEFSLLLGSSLLSSSPPSLSKSSLYLPRTSPLEHKPWSFDVALNVPSQTSKGAAASKRFFCLYRQPNSEHPDIYLHEVWKSQIKLAYADISRKGLWAGEQKLVGTLWVTNASYSKYVSIKYTFNRWLNTCEREAQHRCHSNDYRNIDQYEFNIDIPDDVDRVDFVLRYCVNGQEHWDNNDGKNYTLQTESAYTPSTTISLPHDCDFNEMRFY